MHNPMKPTVEVKIHDKDYDTDSNIVCRIGPFQDDGTVWLQIEDEVNGGIKMAEVSFRELELAIETVKKSASISCYQRGLC